MALCSIKIRASTLLQATRLQIQLTFRPPTLLMSAMAADRRFSYNGLKNFNGYGTKTPFLIGVAGGTASGKVHKTIQK